MKKDHPEFRKLVKEILLKEYSYLIEGIDINVKNKTVSFNPNHENNVGTSTILNPTYDSVNGIPIISIFKRKDNDEKTDGNPLISALKRKRGWVFKNPKEDIINLLKQFIRISEKIKPEYDTIITIPSSNLLNERFLYRLKKIIKTKNEVTDYFFKMNADDVWDDYINWKGLENDCGDDFGRVKRELLYCFKQMEKENDNMFSFRLIPNAKLRKYITKTMYSDSIDGQIKYSRFINDKDVLILDDTITSGKTISEACKDIIKSFTPKSITIITLFSKI